MPSPLIEIPPGDIFKNDRLGLEPAIQGRTHTLLARSPQAIAIDGRWGTGKSTFLALWEAYLRCEGVKVVRFNAWKTFGADPFDALTREILRQVEVPVSEQKGPHRRFVGFIKRHAKLAATGIRLVSIFHPDYAEVSQAAAVGIDSAANVLGSEPNEVSDPNIESPDEFAAMLSAAAKTWSKRPVVVMVDELDRCSPEYSVEFLQLLEHVFHAEHVVFVVAINRAELHHSIKSFYGQGFNAEAYLERFFDDILALPISNRSKYIGSSLQTVESVDTSTVLLFLEASELSLREIDKAIQILKSVRETYTTMIYTSVELWIARTLAPGAYRRFLVGAISDKELVKAVFSNGACEGLRTGRESRYMRVAQSLEAALIVCSGILSGSNMWTFYENPGIESELCRHYQELVEKDVSDSVSVEYAQGVLDLVSTQSTRIISTQDVRAVTLAARLLERELPPE